MTWYKTGTVNVANNSATVTGAGTDFVANVQVGEEFRLAGGQRGYEITAVVSNTQLTIDPPYMDSSQNGASYRIVPVRGFLQRAYDAMSGAMSQWDDYRDGALSGLFDDGAAGDSGFGFAAAPGTGWYRDESGNMVGQRSGSTKARLLSGGLEVTGLLTGSAVQASPYDATPGRLLKVGAAGLGHVNANMTQTLDLNTWRTGGFIRYGSATLGAPNAGAGVVMHLERLAGTGTGFAIQIAFSYLGPIYRRLSNAAGGWESWIEVTQSGAQPALAGVDFSGNVITGRKIVIGQDAVATLTPPRKGGWMTLSTVWNDDYPDETRAGLIYYDVGASLAITPADLGASIGTQLGFGTSALTGTSGVAPKVSVAVQPGVIQVENRSGSAKDFFVTFI